MKKLIIFDLDDTLADSKQDLTEDMAKLLGRLLDKYEIAVISGCSYHQMLSQFADNLSDVVDMYYPPNGVYLLPMSGTYMYTFVGTYPDDWEPTWGSSLTLREKVDIINAFDKSGFHLGESYGPIEEDRISQITFSLCGQNAPLEVKKKFDPDQNKRRVIVAEMEKFLDPSKFSIRIGGATSIDVTKAGIDKSYGLGKLLDYLKLDKSDALFIGDALFEGGNDYPVKQMGIECLTTTGPEETSKLITKLIED